MSLLQRLHGKRSEDLDDICNDIIENITGLLSSKAPIIKENIDENLLLNKSICTYGLKNSVRYKKKYHGKFVFEEIIELLKKFEPRLSDIEIEAGDNQENSNLFEFKIRAVIQNNGEDDMVLFDSCLDFGTNIFKVRKSNFV